MAEKKHWVQGIEDMYGDDSRILQLALMANGLLSFFRLTEPYKGRKPVTPGLS